MTSILQIKCSWFGRHLLLIFLIYCKIWKPIETNGKMKNLSGNMHRFENVSQFKKLYFANKIQPKHLKSVKREIPMSPTSSLKFQSPSFNKQNNVSSVNNENTASEWFQQNFSGKYNRNSAGAHKINFNADSSIINPGDFYRNYFSVDMRPEQKDPTNLKFKTSSPQLAERRILNDNPMKNTVNIFNMLPTPKVTTHPAYQKHNFSNKKNSKVLLKNDKADNEALNPQIVSSEMLSKVSKFSGDNLENKKVIHLKKKTIVTKWRDARTGEESKSRRLHKLFNLYQMQQTGRGNQEMSSGYGGIINTNKEDEGKKSLSDFQSMGTFTDKFLPFHNQGGSFIQKNDAKKENMNYGESVMKIEIPKSFYGELHSLNDHRNGFNAENNLKSQTMSLIDTSENPGFEAHYLKSIKELESLENNLGVQRKAKFGFLKEQQLNGGIQNDISRDNMTKETKESSPEFRKIETFSGKFLSFYKQNETFGRQNNTKYETTNYGKSSTKVQASKGFNSNLDSFQNRQNSYDIENNLKSQNKYIAGIGENPGFNAQYLKNRQDLESYEKKFGVHKVGELALHKSGQQSNWEMQTNIPGDVKVEGKSDSIILKNNNKFYKNNQKNYIQSQTPKEFSRHNSIEINRKVFQAGSLSLQAEGNQTRTSKVTVSSILLSLIILTSTILLLSCCAFFISENRKEIGKVFCICSAPQYLRRNHVSTTDSTLTKYTPLDREHIISNQYDDVQLKREVFKSPTELKTKCYRKESEKFEALKSIKQDSLNDSEINRHAGSQSFSKGEFQIDMQDEDTENNLLKSDNHVGTDYTCTKYDSLESRYDSSSQKDDMHLKKEEIYRSPASLDAEYYDNHSEISETSKSSPQESLKENKTKNGMGISWNWQLKNVKSKNFSKETQHETDQKKSIQHQNKSYAHDSQKTIKKGEYSKEKRMVKQLSPKYSHGPSAYLQKRKADLAVQKQQNTFFTDETLHGCSCTDKENSEQILKRSEVNYPSKEIISSPRHSNVVNVKTKSIVLFHRSDTDGSSSSSDLQSNYKVESNSTSTIFPVQKDKKIISTSVRSIHQMHFNERDAFFHKKDRERDIPTHPNTNSGSNISEFVVETEQRTSDSTE